MARPWARRTTGQSEQAGSARWGGADLLHHPSSTRHRPRGRVLNLTPWGVAGRGRGADRKQDAPTYASRPKSELSYPKPNYSLPRPQLSCMAKTEKFTNSYSSGGLWGCEMSCCCLQYASHREPGHQDCWKFSHQSVVPPVKWGYSLPHKSNWLKSRGHKLLDIHSPAPPPILVAPPHSPPTPF